MQRLILAITTVTLLLGALVTHFWYPESQGTLAFCWRGGLLTGAAWLAFDDVRRLPGWFLLTLPVLLIVAAKRPRLLLTLIPLLIVWTVIRKILGKH